MTFKMTFTNINHEDTWYTVDTVEEFRHLIETLIGIDGSSGQIEGTRTCEPDMGAKVVRDWIRKLDGNAYAVLTNCRLRDILSEKEIAGLAYQKGVPEIDPMMRVAIRERREVFSSVNDASLGLRSYVLEQFQTFTETEARYDALSSSYREREETLHLSAWSNGGWVDYERPKA